MKRWNVCIVFSTLPGIENHNIDELEELQELVEKGRDWNEILEISIQLAIRVP